jgi:AhpD family alkylhydroperoxidase
MRVTVTDEQIRAAFAPVRHRPDFRESGELFDRGQRPLEMIQAMCLRPELLAAFGQFGNGVYPGGLIEQRLKELVILESSRRNACQFCVGTHVAVMRSLGMAEAPLLALDSPAELTAREELALRYTRAAMTDSNRVPDSLFAELRGHFSEPEVVELSFLIGFINMLNMFNNLLQVTYRGEYDGMADLHRS